MSFQPYDRNPSGIVFFGTNNSDSVYESNANFTIDGTSLRATNIKISDGGNIGSVSDADAISIAAGGNVTMTQDLTVTGDLTVNGTTTTIATTNSVVSDSLIELNNGAGSNSNDCGLVIERGSTGDNAIFAWDESADKFTLGTTTATGASTGNLTITTGTLVANVEGNVTGDVTGNADTATALATSRNFSLTGDVTASTVGFDGTGAVALAASLDASAITGQTAETAIADDDLILIYDTSNTALRKMTKANFVDGLSGGGGDITSVVAGDGLTGGATSGAATVNVVGGDGITANANDVAITAAQTTITSVLNAALVIGRDADNDIDFATDNNIIFRAAGTDQLTLVDGALTPSSNAGVDLGTDALEFKDGYFDGTVEADAITIGGTNIVTGAVITTLGTISTGVWNGTAIAHDYIGLDAIDGTNIADNAINSEHYTDGSIDTAHIANDQITNALMADDAIDSPQIADGAVDEVHRTRTVAEVTGTGTLSSDINLCTNTITVTMPSGVNGKVVVIKNIGTGVITISSTPNIDGSSGDHILYHKNETATLVYGASQWNII